MEGKKKRVKNPLDAEKVFPVRLTKLMKEHQKTQSALAERLGVTRQAVANYCDGSSTPSWESIALIAKEFSCSADYLLGLSDYRSRKTEETTLADVGFSEDVSHLLQNFKNYDPKYISGLNLLLDNYRINRIIYDVAELTEKIAAQHDSPIESLVDDRHPKYTDMNSATLQGLALYRYEIISVTQYFQAMVEDITGFDSLDNKAFGGERAIWTRKYRNE